MDYVRRRIRRSRLCVKCTVVYLRLTTAKNVLCVKKRKKKNCPYKRTRATNIEIFISLQLQTADLQVDVVLLLFLHAQKIYGNSRPGLRTGKMSCSNSPKKALILEIMCLNFVTVSMNQTAAVTVDDSLMSQG